MAISDCGDACFSALLGVPVVPAQARSTRIVVPIRGLIMSCKIAKECGAGAALRAAAPATRAAGPDEHFPLLRRSVRRAIGF